MILTDGLPTAIVVDGIEYDINADYQTCLKIIMAFEDNELTQDEKYMLLVELLYKEPPHHIHAAIKQGVKFLDCGDSKDGSGESDSIRKYSFTQDDKYIYRAVDGVLHGRLSKGDFVHWWEFVLAFMELPEDCFMSRLIQLRTQKAKGKLSKEERELYYKIRDIVDLKEEYSVEEQKQINEFMELLK
ncbi:MAG TPA: hypothetical protein DHU59_13550 [Clostridiales bacterium]|nr:hypothetical protein [Clostridiales bacterium]